MNMPAHLADILTAVAALAAVAFLGKWGRDGSIRAAGADCADFMKAIAPPLLGAYAVIGLAGGSDAAAQVVVDGTRFPAVLLGTLFILQILGRKLTSRSALVLQTMVMTGLLAVGRELQPPAPFWLEALVTTAYIALGMAQVAVLVAVNFESCRNNPELLKLWREITGRRGEDAAIPIENPNLPRR